MQFGKNNWQTLRFWVLLSTNLSPSPGGKMRFETRKKYINQMAKCQEKNQYFVFFFAQTSICRGNRHNSSIIPWHEGLMQKRIRFSLLQFKILTGKSISPDSGLGLMFQHVVPFSLIMAYWKIFLTWFCNMVILMCFECMRSIIPNAKNEGSMSLCLQSFFNNKEVALKVYFWGCFVLVKGKGFAGK